MTTSRKVDARTVRVLQLAYQGLVKAGDDSVRAAWRFGQALDSFSGTWTQLQLADALELSVSTLARYLRLYHAYPRPELALEASEEMETYNIDTLVELQGQRHPVAHGGPLAGRHWTYTCRNCRSHDVVRVEVDGEGNPVEDEAILLNA